MTDESSIPTRRRRTVQVAASVAGVAAVVGAVVVFAGGSGRPPGRHLPAPVATLPAGPPVQLTGVLTSFDACSDYLQYMRSQALGLVGPYGLQPAPYRQQVYGVAPGMGVSGAASTTGGSATGGGGTAAPVPAGAAASAEPASAAPVAGSDYSQTDDQVAGVDEPDTVKTDGRSVVAITGSTLRVMDTSARVLGTLTLPGDTGGGMLLDGDRVLVFSSTSVAGPWSTGVALPAVQSMAVPPGAGSAPVAVPSQARVAVVDISDPARPTLVRTFLLDGTVAAARLVAGQVRVVVRTDGPRIEFDTPSGGDGAGATAENRQLLESSTAADWLPSWQAQLPDGSTTARQPLAGCSSIARPAHSSGLSTVEVFTLDPAAAAPGPSTAVVGAGDIVYAAADRLYVAGAEGAGLPQGRPAAVEGCCSVLPPMRAATRIYAFATPPTGAPVFQGVGSVPGWLVNSYAMDEDTAGRLRVATTVQTAEGSSQSQVTVLRPSASDLAVEGAVTGLGPGEFIKSVRFVGDRAYVVTFRSFDPLYVVDLSHPDRPTLSGELDQPGFSEFLYPLAGDRLIGVGVEITEGEPSGLLVATYDVSDAARPRRISTASLASGFQSVAGGYDPHAFLYWPRDGLALVASQAAWDGSGSSVGAFRIRADGSLVHLASLAHGPDTASRSVVVGDHVWVLTGAGVLTAALPDLAATAWHSY